MLVSLKYAAFAGALTVLSTAAVPMAAPAASSYPCLSVPGLSAFSCIGNRVPSITPGRGSGNGSGIEVEYTFGVVFTPGFGGRLCFRLDVMVGGGGMEREQAEGLMVQLVALSVENGNEFPVCEGDSFSPTEIAGEVWRKLARPPVPSPLVVRPGKAITGLAAYLEIGGELPAVQRFDTPAGLLTITMVPRYVIDWGDGASARSAVQGRPFPGGVGEIRHVYRWVDTVTIEVEAYWHASWSLSGQRGDLVELEVPTESSLVLDVEQRQVVTN